jgi:hypothetical protein
MILRTLTLKSTINFGKYAELTVQQIIDLRKSQYLVWVYFCNSHINFFPEVLDLIRIKEEHRIPKPGKINEEEFNKIMKGRIGSYIRGFCEPENIHKELALMKNKRKARQRAKNKCSLERDKIKFSRINMAWRNQGHY